MSTDYDSIENVSTARCHDGNVQNSTDKLTRTRFVVRVREPYDRRWNVIGRPSKTLQAAMNRLVRKMPSDCIGEVLVYSTQPYPVPIVPDPVVVFRAVLV